MAMKFSEGQRMIRFVPTSELNLRYSANSQEGAINEDRYRREAIRQLDALSGKHPDLFPLKINFQELVMLNSKEQKVNAPYAAMVQLYTCAAVLTSAWRHAKVLQEDEKAAPLARQVNRIKSVASGLRETDQVKMPRSRSHLIGLREGLINEMRRSKRTGQLDKDAIAGLVHEATIAADFSAIWIDMPLPGQQLLPYASKLVMPIIPSEFPELHPTVVAYISIANAKKRMIAHMHSLYSDAFEAPIGGGSTTEPRVFNTLYQPAGREDAFPLGTVVKEGAEIGSVMDIAAGRIHSVEPAENIYSGQSSTLQEMLDDPGKIEEAFALLNVGMPGCLDVFIGNPETIGCYPTIPPDDIRRKAGTILFNMADNGIYATYGDAFAIRLAFLQEGKCCGACLAGQRQEIQIQSDWEQIPWKDMYPLIESKEPRATDIWKTDPVTGSFGRVTALQAE